MSSTLSCSSCGHEAPAGSTFCNACGQRVAGSAPARPTSAPSSRLPASFAGGRYRILRFIGEGAKKRVYLAHDTLLERDVALAAIKTTGLDSSGLARVRREARAMGRLGDHPNVVTIYDVGDEQGRPFIVSQYMAGGSVEDLLKRSESRHLPIEQALRITTQVCRALAHAQARGVIHRDLKPANVWLAEDGTARLGDFGLALALDRSRLTLEGMMVGTVAYMPPEQALGRTPDGRGDLYALGALLYELVTGRPPFLGDDAVGVISQHINTPPVAPTWHNPEVPKALEALVLRLLAKAPEDRPANADEVVRSLDAITAALGSGAPAPSSGVGAGETNPLDRLASGVFVGRERELDELRAALEDALSARGRLLMLVGEPGIGKTRTAQELATYARLRKCQLLWGRCYEGEGAPSYWPWVQAIRAYVHEREAKQLASELGSGGPHIAQVVSEVREVLPGLPEPPRMEPEQARFRLFDSVTLFLKNAAMKTPVMLVLDDLHWADKPSLLLLQFLARELAGSRLLVVGTYRDVSLRRQHPLTQTLAELTREHLTARILLRGLSERDVGRFIEITSGAKQPESLVSAVYRETEGNPFFVNEVVRLLVTDGRLGKPDEVKSWSVQIPQGVREVIGRRLDHLSAECNAVLTVASVLGREFSFDALERVAEHKGDRLLELLEEAVAARVIAEVPQQVGHYSFTHALIRETLYEELTTTRRVRLHRQIAEALEALYGSNPEPHLSELAHHFFEAAQGGSIEKAIDYAVRAGRRAASQMAHEEAARQYGLALQAMEMIEPQPAAARCDLLLTLGESLWRGGEFEQAKEIFKQAADIALRLGEAQQLTRAALGYGGWGAAFDAGVVDEVLIDLLEKALAALGEGDSTWRALVMSRLAEAFTFSDRRDRSASLCRKAIEMARRTAGKGDLARVLISTHWALWSLDNLEDRLALSLEIARLGKEAGDARLALEGRLWHLADLLEVGDVEAMDRELDDCREKAEELRQPYQRWQCGMLQDTCTILAGRYEEGERSAQRTMEIGQFGSNPNAIQLYTAQVAAAIHRERGDLESFVGPMKEFIEEFPTIPAWRCALAIVYMEIGNVAAAREEFEALAANNFSDLPRDVFWPVCMGLLAEVCAFLGDTERAATLYGSLLPFAGRFVVIVFCAMLGSVSRYLGLLAATMSRWEEAEKHFEAAVREETRAGAIPWIAHSRYDYAAMLLARGEQGDPEKALRLLTQAIDTAQSLGMKVLLERALALKFKVLEIPTGAPHTSIDAVTMSLAQERTDLRAHASPDGTITILFSDIENSTLMTEKLGDRAWMNLLRDHNRIVRESLGRHGGFEVKNQGDGFMLTFQSAAAALHCAIEMQHAFAAFAAAHPDAAVKVRMGLHTGEAIKEEEDFFGKNVILAARIAARAKGGQVLVSSTLREVTQSLGDFTFREIGRTPLKGLSGDYQIYELAL